MNNITNANQQITLSTNQVYSSGNLKINWAEYINEPDRPVDYSQMSKNPIGCLNYCCWGEKPERLYSFFSRDTRLCLTCENEHCKKCSVICKKCQNAYCLTCYDSKLKNDICKKCKCDLIMYNMNDLYRYLPNELVCMIIKFILKK